MLHFVYAAIFRAGETSLDARPSTISTMKNDKEGTVVDRDNCYRTSHSCFPYLVHRYCRLVLKVPWIRLPVARVFGKDDWKFN